MHNIFHNDRLRNRWLNMVRQKGGLPSRDQVNTYEAKELSYQRLSEACGKQLDIDAVLRMMYSPVYLRAHRDSEHCLELAEGKTNRKRFKVRISFVF